MSAASVKSAACQQQAPVCQQKCSPEQIELLVPAVPCNPPFGCCATLPIHGVIMQAVDSSGPRQPWRRCCARAAGRRMSRCCGLAHAAGRCRCARWVQQHVGQVVVVRESPRPRPLGSPHLQKLRVMLLRWPALLARLPWGSARPKRPGISGPLVPPSHPLMWPSA